MSVRENNQARHAVRERRKPPIGLTPRWAWRRARKSEIIDAMLRYSVDQRPVPVEWVRELGQMILLDEDEVEN